MDLNTLEAREQRTRALVARGEARALRRFRSADGGAAVLWLQALDLNRRLRQVARDAWHAAEQERQAEATERALQLDCE